MLAEIISIGDELTSGQRLDTNSQWLSRRLGEIGIRVLFHTTVADDIEANVRVFGQAAERADVVVATGGLGPTADDLTRNALAELSGRKLVLDENALEHLRAIFAFFGRDMPENNVVQAMFPEGSRMILNPNGTAPGIDLDIPREGRSPARVFALPGVPAEMKQMFEATVLPALRQLSGSLRVIQHRQIRCFGKGESHLERMLPDLVRRGRQPSVGITVSDATITLRITAEGASVEDCQAAIEPTVATIRECLGDLVFGEGDDELEHVVARLLSEWGKTLSVAEWGTGGLVAERLQSASGGSDLFVGGLVVGSPRTAHDLLGVPDSLIAERGANCGEVVEAMAVGCRKRTAADWSLAVGPLPEIDRKASSADRVFFALAGDEGVAVRSAPLVGHPDMLKTRAAKQALNMVRLALLRQR